MCHITLYYITHSAHSHDLTPFPVPSYSHACIWHVFWNDKLEEWRFIAVHPWSYVGSTTTCVKGPWPEFVGLSIRTWASLVVSLNRLQQEVDFFPAEWDRLLWTCWITSGLPLVTSYPSHWKSHPFPWPSAVSVWAAYHFGNYYLVVTVIVDSGPSSVYRSIVLFLLDCSRRDTCAQLGGGIQPSWQLVEEALRVDPPLETHSIWVEAAILCLGSMINRASSSVLLSA